MAYPQPHPPNPNNNNNNFVRNQPGQFQQQSQQHHHHQVTLKTTELAASVSTTTTSSSSSGSSSVPSVEALCKVLGQRAAANDDDDHVRSVVQCGDGLEDELGAKVLRGRRRQEVPSGKKWTLPAPPAAIDEQDYSSGDSSSYFEEMMMKASARRQSKWKEQFDKLANKTRPKKPHLVEEEREGCLEKVKKKPLEKKKLIKQIRRNFTSTFSTQLPVEILEKKKQPPRRHSLFIQRVSDLLQDETGVVEVFKPRIRLNPSPPPTKGSGDKLDEIRQIKQLEQISTLLQESLWSDRVEELEKLAELSSSSSLSIRTCSLLRPVESRPVGDERLPAEHPDGTQPAGDVHLQRDVRRSRAWNGRLPGERTRGRTPLKDDGHQSLHQEGSPGGAGGDGPILLTHKGNQPTMYVFDGRNSSVEIPPPFLSFFLLLSRSG
jgi:hypothetical protein